jgi:hypothetical protein
MNVTGGEEGTEYSTDASPLEDVIPSAYKIACAGTKKIMLNFWS